MNGEPIREYSGRKFSEEDISLIITTTQMYPQLSQMEIASTVCELIGWVTTNGKPKAVQCVEYLRQLEHRGLIKLPKIRTDKIRQKKGGGKSVTKAPEPEGIDKSDIRVCSTIKLKLVRPGEDLARWRGYVSNFHTLGDPHVQGSHLRYMIISEGRDLGCLLFSISSWALERREEWIGWTSEEKKSHLHLIVNNSRFLLFPSN